MMHQQPLFLLPLLALLAACPGREAGPPADSSSVRVANFSPGGTTETRPIEIRFNQPMVEATKVDQELTGSDLLAIDPATPGSARWITRDTLSFVPSEPFRRSTRYTVTVKPEVAPAGKRLEGETTYRFNTELFGLVSIEPYFSGAGVIEVRANLEFSYPVKPDDAQSAIRFYDAADRPINATLETKQADRVMAFRLEGLPAGADGTKVKVVIASSLAASFGGEPLGKEVARELTLVRPAGLVVEQIYPVQEGGQYVIVLRLSDEVDEQSLGQAIGVEPKVKFTVSPSYRGARLVGPFKPGSTFKVTVKKGLVGRQGGILEEELSREVVIADLEPALRFSSEGSYLIRGGQQKIAVESVNVKKLRVTVDKVLENNLVHVLPRLQSRGRTCWDDGCGEYWGEYADADYGYGYGYYYSGYDLGSFGTNVFAGEVALKEQKNEWQSTALSFGDLDKDSRNGLYRVRVIDAERGWSYTEKWLLATDLGITAKVGPAEARAQVISLSTLRPVAGAEVQFISQTNQPIGKVTTDGDGWAKIALEKQRPAEPLSLITVKRGDDFSYLALAGTMIPTADFDVGGEGDAAAPYQAYVYPDRGVYRPGDTAHLTVIVRDAALHTPPVFPYTLEVRNPQWRVLTTLRGSTEGDGARAFDLEIPVDALTGSYAVRVLGAGEGTVLGRVAISVEEFMPDRIKVEVKAEKAEGEANQPLTFEVQSNYLFGPPAKGLRVESTCSFAEVPITTKTFGSFSFGASEGGSRVSYQEDLGESQLDAEGHGSNACAFNGSQPLRLPLRVSLYATVSEGGGRAVTGADSGLVHAHPHYVGVRRNANTSYAETDKPAGLEVVVVDRQGEAKAGVDIEAEVVSVEWKSVLKLDAGRYRYVSERSESKVQSFKLKSAAGPFNVPFTAKRPGSYRLDVTAAPSGARSSLHFWVSGPGWAPWEMSKPDQIALTLDKAAYSPGETAQIMVRAPFEGRLMLSVERERVLYATSVNLTGNTGTFSIPVSAVMTPNAYVVAQLVRSPSSAEKLAPMRAFGVAALGVKAEEHRLLVTVGVPESMRPLQPLEAEIQVQGGRGAVQVTLAAVDEGILRITDFASPDPFAFFTRKRRLSLTTHDLFELLLPEVEIPASALTRAGGGDEVRKKHLTPVSVKRVKPVALWSGLVPLDRDGRGKVRLDVPQFQGSLRVMAVAIEGDRFGAASKSVTVRDPIVLTPTLPRFVGPLDSFTVPVEIFNGTGKDGTFEVSIAVDGRMKPSGEARKTVAVKAGEQGATAFVLQADEVAGKAKVTLRASGNGAETFAETDLPIRPASTVVTEGAALVARYAEPARFKVPGGFMPGTMKVQISVAGVPAAQFGAALQYLLQYPYGCVEQTTSRSFPLLYLKDLAKTAAPELVADQSVEVYVSAGISRLISMLQGGGWVSYWPGSSWGYPWSTVYAAHFLVEAKKAGYAVDAAALDRLLAHLAQLVHLGTAPYYPYGRPDFRTQAYAIYVLALAGKPSQSAALYAADRIKAVLDGRAKPTDVWVDDEIRALIGGALLLGGDRARANDFIGGELSLVKDGHRGTFWSPTRADALLLSVLADVQPSHRSIPSLMKALIDRAQVGRWYNTTENSLALMALGKIGRALGKQEFWGTVRLDGAELKKFNHDLPAVVVSEGPDWIGKELEVTVTGKGTAFVSVLVEGIRAGLLEPKKSGIEVSRSYFTKAGTTVDPKAIQQGDLVVTRIDVTAPPGSRIENVAVVDLLPAGLEIENPRLSGDVVEPWMKDRAVADYVDIRDDRIISFLQVDGGRTSRLYYTARAVTVGDFVLPHVHAEAMYDPATQAYAGGGRATVKPRP